MYIPDIVGISKQIDPNANEWRIETGLKSNLFGNLFSGRRKDCA